MSTDYYKLVYIAGEAAHATKCADRGVAISVDHIGNNAYEFAIWSIIRGKLVQHRLHCSVTPLERLIAHADGFCPT